MNLRQTTCKGEKKKQKPERGQIARARQQIQPNNINNYIRGKETKHFN